MSDREAPRPVCVQIKGDKTDPLLVRLFAYAEKRGIQTATAARILIKAALDTEEKKP